MQSVQISIHASEKEATGYKYFFYDVFPISIHASEKEATQGCAFFCDGVSISIHASEKEATTSRRLYIQTSSEFQSTPPRRRRLHKGDSNFKRHNFNPRLREGGDNKVSGSFRLKEISIHASEKEATKRRYNMLDDGPEFQSTPPRRRRLQHIVIPQLSCTYLVSTTFLSAIFSFISQYIVLFFLF